MSRWLASVNNLLETLDGTAETVVEGVIVGGGVIGDNDSSGSGNDNNNNNVHALGQLFETGRQAVLTNASRMGIRGGRNSNHDYEDDDGDEDDEYDEFTTDDDADDEQYGEEDYEEEEYNDYEKEEEELEIDPEENADVVVEEEVTSQISAMISGDEGLESSDDLFRESTHVRLVALQNQTRSGIGHTHDAEHDDEEALSIEGRRSAASVSDLSFSEADAAGEDDGDGLGYNDSGGRNDTDQPPNEADNRLVLPSTTPLQAVVSTTGTATSPTRNLSSPKVDQSPRQPRRSMESGTAAPALRGTLPILADGSFHDDKEEHETGPDVGTGSKDQSRSSSLESQNGGDKSAAPPRPPRRQSSSRQDNPPRSGVLDPDQGRIPTPGPTLTENQPTSVSSEIAIVSDPIEVAETLVQAPLRSKDATSLPARQKQKHQQQQQKEQEQAETKTMVRSLQAQLAKVQKDLITAQTENKKLHQRVSNLDEKLKSAEAEVEAQAEELHRAGQELAQIRTKAKEEQDELMDEHDEELDELQKEHQSALDTMRQDYERTVAEWKEQCELEQAKRQQEGGDWTKELEEAIQREKDALKRLNEVTIERTDLQTKHNELTNRYESLQKELESERQSSAAALERERQGHKELDEAMILHSKQIAQRQRREAELEQTILELGGALTMAQQQKQQGQRQMSDPFSGSGSKLGLSDDNNTKSDLDDLNFKEKWEQVTEEIETMRVQLAMEVQRRETLQRELQDIARERTDEAALNLMQQQQYDQKVADLESTILRLQSNLRTFETGGTASMGLVSDSNNQQLNGKSQLQRLVSHELEEAKREIRELSEQLLRHQGLAENAKSEILALKGRLQAATLRAEDAEMALLSQSQPVLNSRSNNSSSRIHDVESGDTGPLGLAVRRRVKGGPRARQGVRSIRSALRLGSIRGANPALEQVIGTVDAIDSWMVDTGSFMRQEPLARLGFLLYLVTLHVYCTVLVIFHTTEIEHGDFGSLDSNPRHWRANT